jgi:hypothetical protein
MILVTLLQPFILGNVSNIDPDSSTGKFTASEPAIVRAPFSPPDLEPEADEGLTIITTIKNNDDIYDWNASVITEVRDPSGVTVYLNWQQELVKAGTEAEVRVPWIPRDSVTYQIRTFVISGFDNPQILSLISTSKAKIYPETSQCDDSLWHHVYKTERLKIVDTCKSVTGVIEAIKAEPDGDYHVLVKLDSQYADLINEENMRKQNGNLVVEPICQRPAKYPDEIAACRNFDGHIDIPPVGSRVKVTGSYVLDLQHGSWAEIHPATSILAYEPD